MQMCYLVKISKNNQKIKKIIIRLSFYKELITFLNLNKYIKLYDRLHHELMVYPSIYEGVSFTIIEVIKYGKHVLIITNITMEEIIDEQN
jgi:hypothetical protein